MINQMLYIAGPPGVGKSTLARELTAGWDRVFYPTGVQCPHSTLSHPLSGRTVGLELGVPRENFAGTDGLAMDIGPRALSFVLGPEAVAPFALAEGSRLATRPFLGGLVHAGVRLLLVSLSDTQDVLDERWRLRGSKQNPSWRKGAGTRAERIYDWALATEGVRTIRVHQLSTMDRGEMLDLIRDEFPLIDLRS